MTTYLFLFYTMHGFPTLCVFCVCARLPRPPSLPPSVLLPWALTVSSGRLPPRIATRTSRCVSHPLSDPGRERKCRQPSRPRPSRRPTAPKAERAGSAQVGYAGSGPVDWRWGEPGISPPPCGHCMEKGPACGEERAKLALVGRACWGARC